jgi:RNA-binding protein YlmH
VSYEGLSEEERYLSAHIADLRRLSRNSGVPRFSAFLNEREAVVARSASDGEPVFYGGYEGAARTVCGFFEETYAEEMPKEELFPIRAVTFTYRACDKLSHRDFLGAILALGIKRELVGDILVSEGYAVVFCHETAEELICHVCKAGRVGVNAEKGLTKPLPEIKTKRIDCVVSSLRLDGIVSAAANISRDKSASLIKSGQVNADFSPCLNVSAQVKENTVISVRGVGRFRLSEVSGETKKGRIRVVIEKYI